MVRDSQPLIFTGLLMDDTPAEQQGNALRDALNIRMKRGNDKALLAIINEKSSKFIALFPGYYLGHALVENYLILFTTKPSYTETIEHDGEDPETVEHPQYDYIIKIDMSSEHPELDYEFIFNGTFSGNDTNLGFDLEHPIETVVDIENELIKKVYWVDGKNLPRVVNICDTDRNETVTTTVAPNVVLTNRLRKVGDEQILMQTHSVYDNNSITFDFYQPLVLKDSINVSRVDDSSSMFPAGVIQYAVTYSYLYGPETNISTITPVLPIKFEDRGGKEGEIIPCGFNLSIIHADAKFDRLHIYSILRTGKDTMPTVKRVATVPMINLEVIGDLSEYVCKDPITYYDNNTSGEIIDPYYLQFLGEEQLVPSTIESKDGTLFLGSFTKKDIGDVNSINTAAITIENGTRFVNIDKDSVESLYPKVIPQRLENTSTFKYKEYYKLGIQLQDKYGRWSNPISLLDEQEISNRAYIEHYDFNGDNVLNAYRIVLPTLKSGFLADGQESVNIDTTKYKKVRPLIAIPTDSTRKVLFQGVLSPTVSNVFNSSNNSPRVLSSWFFRPDMTTYDMNKLYRVSDDSIDLRQPFNIIGHSAGNTKIVPVAFENEDRLSEWFRWSSEISASPNIVASNDPNISGLYMEKMTSLYVSNDYTKMKELTNDSGTSIFEVNRTFVTFHSPDVDFITHSLSLSDDIKIIPFTYPINFGSLISEIDIDSGVSHSADGGKLSLSKSAQLSFEIEDNEVVIGGAGNGIQCAGTYYNDDILDDYENSRSGEPSVREQDKIDNLQGFYFGYPWQGDGSFTYDFNRPADAGSITAELKHKTVCNYRIEPLSPVVRCNNGDYTLSHNNNNIYRVNISNQIVTLNQNFIQHFNFDSLLALKLGEDVYYGNIDTMLLPSVKYSKAFNPNIYYPNTSNPMFTPFSILVLGNDNENSSTFNWVKYNVNGSNIFINDSSYPDWGDYISNIGIGGAIRMKYKSSPHLIIKLSDTLGLLDDNSGLTLVDVIKNSANTPYYYTRDEDLVWIPAGDAVNLVHVLSEDDDDYDPGDDYKTLIEWKYGDTWYQRYDCLKTYPYTNEDPNSVVEIGSFMCESRINLEGRYDRNAGQLNKGTLSPTNFNLINRVYSQLDTFFSYKIPKDDYTKITDFSSSFTWTLKKQAGAEIDNWTNLNLTSTVDLDGAKGKLNKIINWQGSLLCFQDNGISQINFNDRVLIPTGDDNPIEITNSYKVDGYRYIESNFGATNKHSICKSLAYLYFRNSKSLLLWAMSADLKLVDVSTSHKMASYFNSIGNDAWDNTTEITNTGTDLLTKNHLKTFYDFVNSDLYIATDYEALYFSELAGLFVSRLSYSEMLGIFNIDNNTYALRNVDASHPEFEQENISVNIYKLNAGNSTKMYNYLFESNVSSSILFVINNNKGLNKLFTNIDARIDVFQADTYKPLDFGFSTIDVETQYLNLNEPQQLQDTKYKGMYKSLLKKKFNVWNLTLPTVKEKVVDSPDNRRNLMKMNRPNGTWCQITLATANTFHDKLLIHDLSSTFYYNYI